MKYIIAVVLSALFVLLIRPTTPALTKTAVHNAKAVETTTKAVTPVKAVQPQPEKVREASVTKPVPQPQKRYAYGCQSYDYLFRQYDWNVNVAEAICQAESGGNPYAYSATADAGLMQIHDGLSLYGSQIYNPSFNISKAYQKYQSQNWHAWTTYNKGYYLSFL